MTDDWLNAMDQGQYTGSVFVDLQKAFDLVDTDILLQKLLLLGVTCESLQWFRSYLVDRKIVTCINDVVSDALPLTGGVPQGSLLGPLLFVIFINDMPHSFEKCKIHLYADDTVLYYSHKNPSVVQSVLNEELARLDTWISRNKLKINYSKTVGMLIATKNLLKKQDKLVLKVRGRDIIQMHNTKYLGVIIDSELKWNIHIENMCKKIGKMVGFLGRLRHYVNETNLKIIYQSVILPHFEYADNVWSSSSDKYLDRLQKLQNRAGRIILKINRQSYISNQQLHDILKWDTLSLRRTKHMHVMMFKILHGLTPNYINENVSFRVTRYSLRSQFNRSQFIS